MSTGTDFGRGATTIGNNGHFLAYVHIAHDCTIGNNVTMTNGVTLAGHCEVGDFVGIGGLRRCISSRASATTPLSPAAR